MDGDAGLSGGGEAGANYGGGREVLSGKNVTYSVDSQKNLMCLSVYWMLEDQMEDEACP